MRDLLNAALQRKTPSGNGGSAMLQSSGSKRRIEKNVSTGNEGGSNVEVDENGHAETENFDEEFGDDGGAPDDEMGRRPEEELEAQPFVHVQPSFVERPRRATSSSQMKK
ncbi:hypothetical protein R1flu_010209 [Riccia fluitans]|uniref:Uncharacterized protein n=1 Tax=Riccia fluitans TaxID=41844 RepID=A0ABD1Z7D7_9MARC